MSRLSRKILLGMGLDNKDGHIRVTKGKNFALLGGSEETHGEMQEKAIKLNEHLDKRRKTLDDISEKEFFDIANDIGLKVKKEKRDKIGE
ncbi:MAG: hypothetical protein WC419_01985 [Candidatus Omnitrophota bacterium]|nr:hypothetical protein [Candidatus Omnitrophota bacterium]